MNDWQLISLVKTSSVHGYYVVHFSGTYEECEERRLASNFPHSMKTVQLDTPDSKESL